MFKSQITIAQRLVRYSPQLVAECELKMGAQTNML
jgi:hypothetical protein